MRFIRGLSILVIGSLFLSACHQEATISPVAESLPTSTKSLHAITPFFVQPQESFPTPTPTFPSEGINQKPILGLVVEEIGPGNILDLVSTAGTFWVRSHTAVSWAAVEPVEGQRNWSVLQELEEELRSINHQGMQTILSVRVTPSWAQKEPGFSCGAIKPEKMRAFANFMGDLVARYQTEPYNVKYWEIWNEPDIEPALVSPDSPYGCWGDSSDPYYGGRYYADMLKEVYPSIKAADPLSIVLIGGLVLDCDPRPGSGCSAVKHDSQPSMFLEGILVNDGGSFFDGVSFHAYDYYLGELGQYSNPNWSSAWNTTGPVLIEKVHFIKDLLNRYGISGKILINTETAILCGRSGQELPCKSDEFENTKAYYLAQSFSSALAEGLTANIWYSLFGWRASGLINSGNLVPFPAFESFHYLGSKLESVQFLRKINNYPNISGYEFAQDGKSIWVLWSQDGEDHPILLPDTPRAGYDVFGNSISTTQEILITSAPILLDW